MSRLRRLRKREGKKGRRIRLAIILAVGIIVPLLLMAVAGIAVGAYAIGRMPKLKHGGEIQTSQTSKVYAADGTLVTSLYYEQDRVIIPLADVPPHLRHAVIAIEDERFYQHKGYDPEAIARALFANLQSGKTVEGASTITQQYVKNTMISREKTFNRKLKEAALAYQLEERYTKDQILEKYLNTIYFGQSFYGVETASLNFFGKNAKTLTLPEAALLAGIIKSPNVYSPYINPAKAKERRDLTLKKMASLKYITVTELKAALATPVKVLPIKKEQTRAPYFVQYVKDQLIAKYGANVVFKGGLRVYTTLDLKLQAKAENAAWTTMNKPGDPEVGIVSLEPKTGYIRAMVGGRDFNKNKYNLAAQGLRQPGSAFKTFVLVAAIEQGISPGAVYASGPVTLKLPTGVWKVNNYTEGSGGPPMTIREGLIKSVNCVYARLVVDVGARHVADTAKKMGIVTPLEPYPAIALGGLRQGVSPLEMASAYGTLAQGGFHAKPIAITKVTDAAGKVILVTRPKLEPAIQPATAYLVTEILQDVIKYGTGRRANIGRPAGGKTGTTQYYRDAWFVGFTPTLSTAVWVGFPKAQVEMNNVHGIRVAGGTFPAQIWQKFMSAAVKGTKVANFSKPATGVTVYKICAETGLLAAAYCPDVVSRTFLTGKGPTATCPIHTLPAIVEVPNVVGLTEEAAVAALTEAGFRASVKYQTSPTVPKGKVIWQSPAGKMVAQQDTIVDVAVSTGPPGVKLQVPDVIGETAGGATETLQRAGFAVIQITATPYDPEPGKQNKVVFQDPPAGAMLMPGDTVSIYVNRK